MKLQPNCQSLRVSRGQYETFCFISKALIGLPTCIWAVTPRTLLGALSGRKLLIDECLHPFYYLLHISSLMYLTRTKIHKRTFTTCTRIPFHCGLQTAAKTLPQTHISQRKGLGCQFHNITNRFLLKKGGKKNLIPKRKSCKEIRRG